MEREPFYSGPEQRFIKDTFLSYAQEAKQTLADVYLPQQVADEFRDNFRIDFSEQETWNALPAAVYDPADKRIHLLIEPNSIIEYAEKLTDYYNGDSTADVAKVLIGAGVARCVLGWRLLPYTYDENFTGRQELHERHYDKTPLLSIAERFDIENGTNLEASIARLSDDRIREINTLRFAIGASLNYMNQSLNWQQQWSPIVQQKLVDDLELREVDFRTARSILGMEDAFRWYDDSTPTLTIGLSFPMSPGEEAESFAALR